MADVATITLQVNTAPLAEGNRALDQFGAKADQAAKSADSFGSSNKSAAKSTEEMTKSVDESHRRISEFNASLTAGQSNASKNAAAQDKLAEAFFKQIDAVNGVKGASSQLSNIQSSIEKARKSGNIDQNNYLTLLGDITSKLKLATAAENESAKIKELFISRLKDQVATQSMSRQELLRYRAAQLGVDQAAERYISRIDEQTRSTEGLADSAQKAGDAIDSLSESGSGVDRIGSGLAGDVARALTGLVVGFSLKGLIEESTAAAARYSVLGVVMNTVGKNAGVSARTLSLQEEQLRTLGISAIESRNNIAKMVSANIDLAKASDLARVAQDAAVIGNTNSSAAYDSLIYGIQSANTTVLRTIGINVDFDNSYKQLASSLGKTKESLTEQERTQARVNAVLEQGVSIAGSYEAAMGEAGKKLQSMTRYAEDAKVELGKSFMGEFTTGVEIASNSLKYFTEHASQVGGVIKGTLGVGLLLAIGQLGKYTAALANSAKTGVATAIAQRQTAIATRDKAIADLQGLQITQRKLLLDQAAAVNSVEQAKLNEYLTRGTIAHTAAVRTLVLARESEIAINATAVQSKLSVAAATNTVAAAEAAAAKAGLGARLGARLASSALGLLGGPLGAAMIAGGALYYFYQQANEARDAAINLSDALPKLNEDLKSLSSTLLKNESFKNEGLIDEQRKQVQALSNELEGLDQKIARFKKTGLAQISYENPHLSAEENQAEFTKQLNVLEAERAQKLADSEKATNGLNQLQERQVAISNELIFAIPTVAAHVRDLTDDLKALGAATQSGFSADMLKGLDDAIAKSNQQLDIINTKLKFGQKAGTIKEAIYSAVGAEGVDINKQQIDEIISANGKIGENASEAQKKVAELYAAQGAVYERGEQLSKQEKSARGAGSGHKDDAATKEILASQQRLASLKEQLSATQGLTTEEKQLAKFNREIADLKAKSILTAEQQSLLSAAEQIRLSLEQESSLARQVEARKKELDLMRQMDDYTASIARKSEQSLSKYGLSSRQSARVDEEMQLKNTFVKGGGMFDESGNAMGPAAKSYNEARAAQDQFYADEEQKRGDWQLGVQAGWSEYLDSATNTYSAMSSVAQSALGGMSNMLTDLVTTGTTSFKQFTVSILKMLVDIINRMMVAYAIQQAMGWIAGGASGGTANGQTVPNTPGNSIVVGYDSGGYTGAGGKYEPAGVVHRGEFVMTKEATERIGVGNLYSMMRGYADGGVVGKAPMHGLQSSVSGAGGIIVNMGGMVINAGSDGKQQPSGGNTDAGSAIMKQLKPAIVDAINEQAQRPGTPLWNALKGGR